ncbi:hypothetical protein BLA29_002610, partial [Euroglyphus maynei]
SKRESVINEYRDSVLQKQQPHSEPIIKELEIIPAYMPYLMRPTTKITIKGPILFPVLQNLIDNHTNYEFTLNDNNQKQNHNNDEIVIDPMKFIVKQEEEIIMDKIVRKLMDDLLNELEQDEQMNDLLNDLLDAIVDNNNGNGGQQQQLKKSNTIQQRPTTLSLNKSSDGYRKLSILVNQCSMIQQNDSNNNNNMDEKFGSRHHPKTRLIPSTLISPDTPRSKQKYQQLFLDGNAYSNLDPQ